VCCSVLWCVAVNCNMLQCVEYLNHLQTTLHAHTHTYTHTLSGSPCFARACTHTHIHTLFLIISPLHSLSFLSFVLCLFLSPCIRARSLTHVHAFFPPALSLFFPARLHSLHFSLPCTNTTHTLQLCYYAVHLRLSKSEHGALRLSLPFLKNRLFHKPPEEARVCVCVFICVCGRAPTPPPANCNSGRLQNHRRAHTHTHSLSFSLPCTFSLCLSLALSLSFSFPYTHACAHTHTYSLFVSFLQKKIIKIQILQR